MSILSDTVVSNEPVVDVEDDEEGGEAGEGDDIEDARVVDQEHGPVLEGHQGQKQKEEQDKEMVKVKVEE